MDLFTPVEQSYSYSIVKYSKFHCHAFSIKDIHDLKEHLKDFRKQYNDSSHVVYAYKIINDNGVEINYSDAGEPSQTAGKPIADILSNSNLINIAVIVVRYYGGIMLGKGGLIRAYSQSAKLSIDKLILRKYFITQKANFDIEYHYFDILKSNLQKYEIIIIKSEFFNIVSLEIEISKDRILEFENFIKNLTNDTIKIQWQ